jgi:hypothetical protein
METNIYYKSFLEFYSSLFGIKSNHIRKKLDRSFFSNIGRFINKNVKIFSKYRAP